MRSPRPTAFSEIAILGGLAAAASTLYARDARYAPAIAPERMLYLNSGQVAGRVMLTFDALAADVYWIRAIQHYGRDRKSNWIVGRFELLHPLLELTTSLDPRFSTAYRFGAIFLAMAPPDGPGRPDQAIALLEKGLRASPDRWQYAHDIGFVHYWHTGDFAAAADWFEAAARMPSAPAWIGPLAALTKVQGGDRNAGRRMLQELLESPEGYIRQVAERGLLQLQALEGIDLLQQLVDKYHQQTGSYPKALFDLTKAGLLPGIPVDPARIPFAYDPASHVVSLNPASPLGPLPQGLLRR